MPRANQDNVRRWTEQSDIDYFTQFIKAWIPFNAWYRVAYATFDRERDILDQVKVDGNRIRSRFIARLEGTDPDAELIRNTIARLHRRLSEDPLRDRRERRISFENVAVGRNTATAASLKVSGFTYTADRRSDGVVCQVLNRRAAVTAVISQPGGWDDDEFQITPDFLALDIRRRAATLSCYRRVNPYIVRSLLAEDTAGDPLLMDSYHFVREPAAIFAGVIDVLYDLRNLLFHGELVPDREANRTYEPAYHLLRYLVSTIV